MVVSQTSVLTRLQRISSRRRAGFWPHECIADSLIAHLQPDAANIAISSIDM